MIAISKARRFTLMVTVIILVGLSTAGFLKDPQSMPINSTESTSTKQHSKLAGFISAAAILYSFVGLAIICDGYFTSSLESITTILGLSEDVAGATFMAIGSSAPELFCNLLSFMTGDKKGDLGVGAIVGSAVFNILVIIGITALLAGKTLELDYRPLLRDSLFYIISVGILTYALVDGEVSTFESIIFVCMYVCYVFFMIFNSRILTKLPEPKHIRERSFDDAVKALDDAEVALLDNVDVEDFSEGMPAQPRMANIASAALASDRLHHAIAPRDRLKHAFQTVMYMTGHNNQKDIDSIRVSEPHADDAEDPWYKPPDGGWGKIWWLITLPLLFAMGITIPDCKKKKFEKFYMVTFIMSVVWIGAFSYAVVEFASIFGSAFGISEDLLGVTLVAAGTSVPDALSSVLVARDGQGGMAVSNAIGSNVFDILVGLGAPWLIFSISRGAIEMPAGDLFANVIFLLSVVVLLLIIIGVAGWKLSAPVGATLLMIYAVFFGYNLMKIMSDS